MTAPGVTELETVGPQDCVFHVIAHHAATDGLLTGAVLYGFVLGRATENGAHLAACAECAERLTSMVRNHNASEAANG